MSYYLKNTLFIAITSLLVFTMAPHAWAGQWSEYHAPDYGFSMLIPSGAQFAEKEYENGWGSLIAKHQGVKLFALGKLGTHASAEEIEKFGIRITGIPNRHWTLIDEGEYQKGWEWYRTVKAEHNGEVLFGGYGVGVKGSYLLLMLTTAADFESHYEDYKTWYRSVELHD